MNENFAASDWAATRGEKWCAQLTGMEAMIAPVDEPLIRALHLDAPCRIADVGCGGGGTTLEILRRAPAGSVVHGFDIAPASIERARTRTGATEGNIAFQVGDVATAAPPEWLYGRVASRFGVMFFDDPPAAFANLFRWLEPGGRFAFAVWGNPEDNPWLTSVREVTAEIIEMPPLDLKGPGPFRYADPQKLLTLLEAAGFGEIEVADWRGALQIGGGLPAGEAAHFALASFSTFGELLAKAGDAALNEAGHSLTALFSRNQQAGTVRMEASVHILTGLRPL